MSDGYCDLASGGEPLSPLDGRYRAAAAPLANYLSEAGLNRARVHVEIEWFIFLLDRGLLPGAPTLSDAERDYLRALPRDFNETHVKRLAEIEAETRHDVKAVEYLIGEYLDRATEALGGNLLDESARNRPHFLHVGRHQQPGLRANDQGCYGARMAACSTHPACSPGEDGTRWC